MSLSIPPIKPGMPLLGNIPEIARSDILSVAIEGQRQLGDLFTLRLLGHELVVMCHPDHAEQVLFTHKDRYIKGQGYDAFRLLVGQGLITLEEGDTWRRARRLAAPPFLKARVGRHLEAMRAAAEAVAARWAALPAGTEVDLSEEMAQFAMRVVLSTVMPLQGAEDLGRLHQVLLEGLRFTNERGNSIPLPLWLPTASHRRWHKNKAELDAFMQRAVDAARGDGQGPEASLVHAIVHATDPDGGPLSDEQLRDHILSLFLAGYETSARALGWAFYLLATEPEASAPMIAELDAAGPRVADPFALEQTGFFVQELLRLYTPTWAVVRQAVADDELKGFRVPKGAQVLVAIHQIHRHPDFWPEPLAFRPQRFASPLPEHRGAYIPFSAGSRVCLGNHFALLEMATALAVLAPRFSFQADTRDPVGVRAEVLLQPTRPLRVTISPRESPAARQTPV